MSTTGVRDERYDHTEGPWEFDGVCQIVDGKRPHMRVAFLPSDHAEYASSEANGRLIAAAPDLLAELEYVVRYHEEGLMPLDLREWKQRAYAALKKARQAQE